MSFWLITRSEYCLGCVLFSIQKNYLCSVGVCTHTFRHSAFLWLWNRTNLFWTGRKWCAQAEAFSLKHYAGSYIWALLYFMLRCIQWHIFQRMTICGIVSCLELCTTCNYYRKVIEIYPNLTSWAPDTCEFPPLFLKYAIVLTKNHLVYRLCLCSTADIDFQTWCVCKLWYFPSCSRLYDFPVAVLVYLILLGGSSEES